MLLSNRVPVEAVLLLAEDKGRGNGEAVLEGSKRDGGESGALKGKSWLM